MSVDLGVNLDLDLDLDAAGYDEDGCPTDVIDTTPLTCGGDPAAAALGATDLLPADPDGFTTTHPLAVTAPGPELATLLAIYDSRTLGDSDLVTYVAAAERLKAWTDAKALTATAELAARCARLRGVGTGADQVPAEQVAATELAAGLSLSPTGGRMRVELAESLRRLPRTRIALASGRIDLPKARAIADALTHLPDAAAQAVEAGALEKAGRQTLPQLTAGLRRAVLAADPAAAETRRQAARLERGVWRQALDDGMSRLEWVAPSVEVEAGYQWLTGHALLAQAGDRRRVRGQRAAGTSTADIDEIRTLDQCRSDVLADLATDGLAHDRLPTRHGRPAQIGVVVAASTLRGDDDEPAELVGVGPITAVAAREVAADGVWRRLLTDPAGQVIDISACTYQPPQAMQDLVNARDRTCRGPGCRMPAERCDLDHTEEWPCGPTCAANLTALCRTHHRVKTLTDASYRSDGHGGQLWTLPSGRGYHRLPEPILDHPALVARHATGPPDREPPPEAGPDVPPF